MKTSLILTICTVVLFFACEDPSVQLEKWEVHDISLTAVQKYENPYLEVDLFAEFTAPSGKVMKINGFWDGGTSYIVRFTPTETGTWTYAMKNNMEDAGLTKEGTIEVTDNDPSNHGFLRRDEENPYHFIWDDGTRHYMCGTTYYNILLNALISDKWKTAIDSAKVFGINKYRAHLCPAKSESSPQPNVYPFSGEEGNLNYTELNLTLWRKMDQVIRYSMQQGMNVDLMPFGFDQDGYSDDIELDKRYLRYAIARYAAFPNVIWCLVNEWNYRAARLGKEKPYWNDMGRIVRSEDPWLENGAYLRPLSIHQQTRIDFQFFDYEWPVHAIVQLGVRNGQGVVKDEWDIPAETQPQYKHGDEWGNASIVYNLGHDMPVVNDEFGYIGEPRDRAASNSSNRDEWPRFTRERHRNVLWGIAVAGGYGSAGDKNAYDDGKPYFSANWHSDPPEYGDIKNMVDFFTQYGIEYWKMHSHNELITQGERVYAFAEPGKQYVFYAAIGGDFAAEIENKDYEARLFDPRTGELSPIDHTGDGSFSLPYGSDWVIYLKDQ